MTVVDMLVAVESHYREQYPDLQRHDNILFFTRMGVVLTFYDDYVVLVTDIDRHHSEGIVQEVVDRVLSQAINTNLAKLTQRRAWKYLLEGATCFHLDYGDPRLFTLTDEALGKRNNEILHHLRQAN